MVSFIMHMGIGIMFAELIMRLIDDDPEFRKDIRLKFWWLGLLGGLSPDLDVIPSLFTGEHAYTYHHYFTHTFLAVGILVILLVIMKFNPLMLVYFAGYFMHLTADFIDNSISPLGPFDIIFLGKYIEWGLLCGWQEMPCIKGVCGWASEFWLYPKYKNHDLWTIFMNNGWGVPIGFEFLSYYDIAFIIVSIPLILWVLIMSMKKLINK